MDTEYILSCAAELGEVTPLELFALSNLKSAYGAVRVLVDRDEAMPEHFLQNTARKELARQPEAVQHVVALESLRQFEEGLRHIAGRASALVQQRIQNALGISEPSPFNDLIGATTKALPCQMTSGADVTERNVASILDQELGHFAERLKADYKAVVAAADWYRRDNGAQFRETRASFNKADNPAGQGPTFFVTEVAPQFGAKNVKEEHFLRRKARSAIKKATRLIAQLGYGDNLNLLISNRNVELSHPDSPFKFVITPNGRQGWLEARTSEVCRHTPFDLCVLTKDEIFVARLCVYIEETPVLDQLLALTLFVDSGSELSILESANWFGFGDESTKELVLNRYPELERKYPRTELAEGTNLLFMENNLFARQHQHWMPFKGRVEAWISSWLDTSAAPLLELTRRFRNPSELSAPQPALPGTPVAQEVYA